MTKAKKNTKTNGKTSGIRYKFFEKDGAIMFIIAFGQDMQKQLKIKKGSKLVVERDKENPYKIVIRRTLSKKEATHTLVKNPSSNLVHFTPVWKFKKPPARLLKQPRKNAKVKIRENDFVIELI